MRTHHPAPKVPSLRSCMTPFPHTIDIAETASVALLKMEEYGIHHLPVTEQHQLMGIVSQRDIVRSLGKNSIQEEILVRDVYHSDLYSVELDAYLPTVLLTLAERNIGCAVVLRHGKLAGIFTVTDACRSFAEFLKETLDEDPKEIA